MSDRIRFINPDGRISVRDLAFSQLCELLSGFTREEKGQFDDGVSLIVREDNHFARKGTDIKLVRL
jgi:hypothetical protein